MTKIIRHIELSVRNMLTKTVFVYVTTRRKAGVRQDMGKPDFVAYGLTNTRNSRYKL